MKKVIKYETLDGLLHDSLKQAQKHLEFLHGDKLARLAHKMIQIDKYVAMGDFIDANLNLFFELQNIKSDMIIETDFNEDDFKNE